ncbi:MAG: VWA domain-containing protein [Clostridiales Family XIII bacterium]|nr:VWA domain-containing protein [Clostridiales Family XIII bacterium]
MLFAYFPSDITPSNLIVHYYFIFVKRKVFPLWVSKYLRFGQVYDNIILDDIDQVDNTELYSRMLAEFPSWLKEAGHLGII